MILAIIVSIALGIEIGRGIGQHKAMHMMYKILSDPESFIKLIKELKKGGIMSNIEIEYINEDEAKNNENNN